MTSAAICVGGGCGPDRKASIADCMSCHYPSLSPKLLGLLLFLLYSRPPTLSRCRTSILLEFCEASKSSGWAPSPFLPPKRATHPSYSNSGLNRVMTWRTQDGFEAPMTWHATSIRCGQRCIAPSAAPPEHVGNSSVNCLPSSANDMRQQEARRRVGRFCLVTPALAAMKAFQCHRAASLFLRWIYSVSEVWE